jgi:hypothetical protein
MPSFRLTWTIDIDAPDPVAAARRAREYQLRPDAEVGVFDVVDEQGSVVMVDLDADDATEREQRPAGFPFRIESVRPIEGEEALLGIVYIFGVLHHAWFVRVATDDDDDQVAVDDPYGRLEEFRQLDADGGRLRTVEVPGFPGREYVLVIYPAGV